MVGRGPAARLLRSAAVSRYEREQEQEREREGGTCVSSSALAWSCLLHSPIVRRKSTRGCNAFDRAWHPSSSLVWLAQVDMQRVMFCPRSVRSSRRPCIPTHKSAPDGPPAMSGLTCYVDSERRAEGGGGSCKTQLQTDRMARSTAALKETMPCGSVRQADISSKRKRHPRLFACARFVSLAWSHLASNTRPSVTKTISVLYIHSIAAGGGWRDGRWGPSEKEQC